MRTFDVRLLLAAVLAGAHACGVEHTASPATEPLSVEAGPPSGGCRESRLVALDSAPDTELAKRARASVPLVFREYVSTLGWRDGSTTPLSFVASEVRAEYVIYEQFGQADPAPSLNGPACPDSVRVTAGVAVSTGDGRIAQEHDLQTFYSDDGALFTSGAFIYTGEAASPYVRQSSGSGTLRTASIEFLLAAAFRGRIWETIEGENVAQHDVGGWPLAASDGNPAP